MKRPTEADLDTLAVRCLASATEPETANVSAQLALDLIGEIRRLRAIILSAAYSPGRDTALMYEAKKIGDGAA